jgi:hypothetical protein
MTMIDRGEAHWAHQYHRVQKDSIDTRHGRSCHTQYDAFLSYNWRDYAAVVIVARDLCACSAERTFTTFGFTRGMMGVRL